MLDMEKIMNLIWLLSTAVRSPVTWPVITCSVVHEMCLTVVSVAFWCFGIPWVLVVPIVGWARKQKVALYKEPTMESECIALAIGVWVEELFTFEALSSAQFGARQGKVLLLPNKSPVNYWSAARPVQHPQSVNSVGHFRQVVHHLVASPQ